MAFLYGEKPSVDLEVLARAQSVAQALNENVRRGSVPLAEGKVDNDLRVAFKGHKTILIAQPGFIFRLHALLLLADERPDLIALNVADDDVSHHACHDFSRLLPRVCEHFQDGVAVGACDALHGSHGAALYKQLDDHDHLLSGKAEPFYPALYGIAIGLLARQATIALGAIPVLAETGAFDIAFGACHKRSRQETIAVCQRKLGRPICVCKSL